MTTPDELIRTLREAVQISPDNVPLRQHLAQTLLNYGRFSEAEAEYRAALALAPQRQKLQFGLAKALAQQEQLLAAIALLAEIIQHSPDIIPADVYLLHARLLLKIGQREQALGEYFKAIDADPNVADPILAEQLGLRSNRGYPQAQQPFYHPENEDLSAPGSQSGPPTGPLFDDEYARPDDALSRDGGLSRDGRIRLTIGDEGGEPDLELERPRITFADVGGMEQLKEEIRLKIIHPLTYPEIYAAYGKKIGGGILMYGPPGCGKTHLARATAGEVKATFIAVGINDILDMWLGNSERNMHQIFEVARRHKPCVLFFDEVDALGAKRADMRLSAGRHIINQFLAELDGVRSSNEGVLILAATNAPWHLDSAFMRPGRFDRVIFVPPPDQGARANILHILLKNKPIKDVDFGYLAKKLKEFSGADLQATVEIAVETKLREAMQQGVPGPLTTKDLQSAANTIKPSTKDWFASARNYALYANQSGLYDDILNYLKLK